MSYETLIRFCSPTLAGIKVSNLVNVKFKSKMLLYFEVYKKNELLNKKGIYVEIVAIKEDKALIYVYRKSALEIILKNEENREF